MDKKTLAIDFDGVIHKYSSGWTGVIGYDEPVEGAKDVMKYLMRNYNVVIHTTCLNPVFKNDKALDQMLEWLEKYGFKKGIHYTDITNNKPPAIAYIDDRAIRFTNWKDIKNYF
jgi:5'(3')-deoxyribonucleotidase